MDQKERRIQSGDELRFQTQTERHFTHVEFRQGNLRAVLARDSDLLRAAGKAFRYFQGRFCQCGSPYICGLVGNEPRFYRT